MKPGPIPNRTACLARRSSETEARTNRTPYCRSRSIRFRSQLLSPLACVRPHAARPRRRHPYPGKSFAHNATPGRGRAHQRSAIRGIDGWVVANWPLARRPGLGSRGPRGSGVESSRPCPRLGRLGHLVLTSIT
jgi:hypothetical protein